MNRIHSILIANRGEPVRRAIRTFRKLGIKVATLATPEDRSSPWVAEADLVLGLPDYLDADAIIAAAKKYQLEAVWPGWGFLSERASFAQAVLDAGLIWIGPPPQLIAAMGSKAEATQHASRAGLKTIPETVIDMDEGIVNGFEKALLACREQGYPILLKPAWGGGGQGQQVVRAETELRPAWETVTQANAKLFQSGPILVQRYFEEARHIETQLLADRFGSVVVLGERDCSLQRRNQKVIEEAPSPALSATQRQALIQSSAQFARQIGYQSAGTIEFLYAAGEFWFLEMNTRLQVEHPVTEETIRIGGEKIDLVTAMVRVAQGEPLPFQQAEVCQVGHAIEARIYAEDPAEDFRPSPGRIASLQFPEGLRVESAFNGRSGEVSSNYDPMIAKLISWGEDRTTAIQRLDQGLRQTVILGLHTNVGFCSNILRHPDFQKGAVSTRFLSQQTDLRKISTSEPGLVMGVAGILYSMQELGQLRHRLISPDLTSLLHILQQIPSHGSHYEVELEGKSAKISIWEEAPHQFRVIAPGISSLLEVKLREDGGYNLIRADGQILSVWAEFADSCHLHLNGQSAWLKIRREGKKASLRDPHAAPMAGQVVAILVKEGQRVTPGDDLFQIESMKMISTIRAVQAGRIHAVEQVVGTAVKAGDAVVQLIRDETSVATPLTTDKEIWQTFAGLEPVATLPPLELLKNFFSGFDIPPEKIEEILSAIPPQLHDGTLSQLKFGETVTQVLKNRLALLELFIEHTHAVAFLAERGSEGGRWLPHPTVSLLNTLLPAYGLTTLSQLDQQPRPLIHLFQAFRHYKETKERFLIQLLQICQQTGVAAPQLAEPLSCWLKERPLLDGATRQQLLSLLARLDPNRYHEVEQLPIAPDYLEEYRSFQQDPTEGIPLPEYRHLIDELQNSSPRFTPLQFETLGAAGTALKKWFAAFQGRALPLPQKLVAAGMHLFELDGNPRRFVVVGLVPDTHLEKKGDRTLAFPGLERGAIEAYRTLKLAQAVASHQPNHVFLFSTDPNPIPWRTRDGEGDKIVLTPQSAKQAALRVSGFAADIQIAATEVIVPLLNDADQKIYWTDIEIRHAKPRGLISRPPFLLHERKPEVLLDREKQMNERQNRMGKLLNRDRAMLLFDNGEFEEIFFPEVDEAPEIGLNVYRGQIYGIPTLAYASDFRFRGGALGEREGKKLASAVVLAYLTGRALIAFHDGAGANIKDSVASLGWAGSYFGAIAQTGGFSDKEKFRSWFFGHHERAYFEKVLRHFGLLDPNPPSLSHSENPSDLLRAVAEPQLSTFPKGGSINNLIDTVPHQLIHFHLHVGATVGMLVYGAAIAHASLMNDQPESYRVLTGAATVERVLGEKSSNYHLGGAKAHAEASGDIEMVFATEEQVIDQARQLLRLVSRPKKTLSAPTIQRDPNRPLLEVPKQAGVILGRDALKAHVDHGNFFETRTRLKQATGILTGYAAVGGEPVALAATATDYGLSHPRAFKKVTGLAEAAQDLSLPLIIACGAQWQALSRSVPADWLRAREELVRLLGTLQIPKVSLALGPRSVEQMIHHQMDLTLYIQRDETPEELVRAEQLCPLVCNSVGTGFDRLAQLLRYLPILPLTSGKRHRIETADSEERTCSLPLPSDLTQSYPMRAVIQEVFDRESFLELWSRDKLPLITGLASLGGIVVGVIADDPEIEGGAQNIESIAKFTRMHRLCARFGLPLVELNDSPAFRPGREQEHGGIQGEGGKSIREECLSAIPKIAVTLRQNYGGRLIHANLVTLGPPRVGLVLQGAKIGVMGAKGAIGVLYGKKLASLPPAERKAAETAWQKEYEAQQLNPENAVRLGYISPPIPPTQLRHELCRALVKS